MPRCRYSVLSNMEETRVTFSEVDSKVKSLSSIEPLKGKPTTQKGKAPTKDSTSF